MTSHELWRLSGVEPGMLSFVFEITKDEWQRVKHPLNVDESVMGPK